MKNKNSRTFRGGIHPPYYKHFSADSDIDYGFSPKTAAIGLAQHIGAAAVPIVKAGDIVRKGQLIAEASGNFSANIHSSISGKVKAIKKYNNPLGLKSDAIIIETPAPADKENADAAKEETQEFLYEPIDYTKAEKQVLLNRIKEAGIVGLGGAAFPTHIKYDTKGKRIDTLIINGAECEPFITADDVLMQEKASEIIEGIKILQRISGAKSVWIGIEGNKPKAIEEMQKVLPSDMRIAVLPVKYPQGAEKQLINALTELEVPRGGLPLDVGVVVNNISTAYAVYNAVVKGIPLYERVVTISGDLVGKPRNIMAPVGSSFSALLEYCEADLSNISGKKLINGGPMMGIALYTTDAPTTKGTSSVLLLSEKITDNSKESPCIRCSRCVEACPMNLMPNTMYKLLRQDMISDAKDYGTLDCIECGSCAYVCPAKIPLVQMFRIGKVKIRNANV